MPAAAVHPSREVLAAFGSGQLADQAASTVSEHLEQCATCTALVADLEPDSFAAKLENAKPSGSSIPPGRGSTRVSGLSSMGKNSSPAGAPVLELPVELAEHPKFRIIRELGRGGMGVVYLAEHKIMGRQVALKVLNPAVLDSPDALPRFIKEVQAAAQLDHANIVRAHDAEQAGNLHFLMMEFVEGTDLAKLVEQKGPLTPSIACYFGRQAALGLQHAHEKGMTHRDIKPHNLMATPKGLIKVLDFGLARVRSEGRNGGGLTAAEAFMGTPEYVAPEQATDARQADIRSDIYSLGCTLYYLLTGRPPFREDTVVKTVLAQISKAPRPLHEIRPEIPAELSALVDKMLAKDPAKRFQTPGEVAKLLMPFIKRGAKAELPAALPEGAATPAKGPALSADSSQVKEPGEGASQLSAKQAPAAKPAINKSLANLEDARVSAPKKETQRHADKPGAAPAWKRLPVLAGVAVAVLALILGGLAANGVFKVKTKDGTIVLENLPADADVTVDGGMVLVKSSDGKTFEVSVAPGKKHRLEIKKDGFKVFGEEVELDAGGRQSITARLEPLPAAVARGAGEPLPKTFTNSLGMEFALVPKGKSWLGGGGGRPGDKEVVIAQDFYLGTYKVTQEEWQKILSGNPSRFSRQGQGQNFVKDISDGDLKRFPVEMVSWNDAQLFLAALNAKANEAGWVYRLPKDAEWEYACRGGPLADRFDSAFDFYFEKPANQLLPEQANFEHGKGLKRTCMVGTYQPNRLGLYDMHGNVWEWCDDSQKVASGESFRVLRGGSWAAIPWNLCRAAGRITCPPTRRYHDIGLRVVRVPVEQSLAAVPIKEPVGDQSRPSTAVANQIPPAGPARRALRVTGTTWTVADDELVKEGLGRGTVTFGDEDWSDYDLTFEARKTEGVDGLGAAFRLRDGKLYSLVLGALGNKHLLGIWASSPKVDKFIQSTPGILMSDVWYKVKISLRGQDIRVELNDRLLFRSIDSFSPKGNFFLCCYNSAGRFRNIRVTAPDGAVLWNGLPDLVGVDTTPTTVPKVEKANGPARLGDAVSLEQYRQRIEAAWPGLGNRLTKDKSGNYALHLRDCKQVTDLTPLQGMPLTTLNITYNGELRDLTPLQGMNLKSLWIGRCGQIRDLSPLQGMELDFLDLAQCNGLDLTQLKGMKIKRLSIWNRGSNDQLRALRGVQQNGLIASYSPITDLSPLKGMAITELIIDHCDRLSDLRPLNGTPLKTLNIKGCDKIVDATPLHDLPLKEILCDFKPKRDAKILRGIKTLEKINDTPVAQFWKDADAKP